MVEEVNGSAAAEVIGFLPTRHELLELARFWANVAVDIEYFWFRYQKHSSAGICRRTFAWKRVARIQELLGADGDKVVDEVYEKFGKNQNDKYWEAFMHGDYEQRKAAQEEIARIIEDKDANQNAQ